MHRNVRQIMRSVLTVVVLSGLSLPALAQTSEGSIAGNVFDPSGALVPNAKILARDVNTGSTYNTVSSSAGTYRFPNLRIGTYDVTATAEGFKSAVFTGILVQTATTAALDIKMQTGAVTENVTVLADVPTIQTESADIGTVVSEKQILDLPLPLGTTVQNMDYDNDGWKDLFIAQAHVMDNIEVKEPHLHYLEPPLLVRNVDGKKFVDVSTNSGDVFHQRWAGRGLATGDIDNDGRVDVVVTSNDGPVWVLRNETSNTNHWITLKLVGVRSNRDAIGAQVEVTTDAGTQYGTVTTASSYESSSDARLHFGLGASATIKSIKIRWPSGIVQSVPETTADQIVTIKEAVPTGK